HLRLLRLPRHLHPGLHRRGLLDRTGADRRRREIQGARAVVVTRARRSEGDLVAVAKHLLTANALAIDVRAVEAAQIPQDELSVALLEDAVLLGDNLVQELDGVVRVAPQAVDRAKFDRLLPLGGREDQTCHLYLEAIVPKVGAGGQRGMT